jgi:hypothetical protein
MSAYAVQVSNISSHSNLKEVEDFFSFWQVKLNEC